MPSKAFINGKFVDPVSQRVFEDICPRDGTTLATVAACDENDIDMAVRSARDAFSDGRWSNLSPRRRKHIMI